MVPARLTVVTLGARDLARLRSFYSALGWEVAIEAEDFCAFQLRGALLALFPREKLAADGQARAAAPARGMRGFSLGINVDGIIFVSPYLASATLNFGDADNDLEMLEGAAISFAVADATAAALERADHVTAPAKEGGWADLVGFLDLPAD